MPVSFAQVMADRKTVSIPVSGETLNVTYTPSVVTEDVFAQVQSFAAGSSDMLANFKTLNDLLVELIESWDFYEDLEQTQLIPITVERLRKVPMLLRTSILQAILGDIRPNDVTA